MSAGLYESKLEPAILAWLEALSTQNVTARPQAGEIEQNSCRSAYYERLKRLLGPYLPPPWRA